MNREALSRILAVAIILVFSAITLYRLANAYFWQDEAYVGFMAANYLKSGHLSCWDGRNMYVIFDGAMLKPDFTQTAQWDPYLSAVIVSFKLFGVSTWAARVPAVIFGILTVTALVALLRFEFPKKPALRLYALALLAFSAQFLVDARTARYYTFVSLFAVLTFYFYRRFTSSRSWSDAFGLSMSAIGLFYGHLLGGLSFIVALVVTHLLWHRRDYAKQDWSKIAVAAVVFVVAATPYVVANKLWSYARSTQGPHGLAPHLWVAWLNLRDINITNCLPWMCAAGLIVLMRRNRAQNDMDDVRGVVRDWASMAVVYAIALGLLCALSQVSMLIAVLRYLSPILPFLTCLTAVFIWMVYRISKPVSVGIFLVIVCSNVFTLTPLPPLVAPATDQPRSLLPAYLHEITHPYVTSDEAVSKFLRRNATRDDVVATYPTFHAATLNFYDGDFIRTGCQLDKKCPLPVDLIHSLHAPLYVDENFPNWVVFYGPETDQPSTLQIFSRPHYDDGKLIQYRYVTAQTLKVYYREINRGELTRHEFVPPPVTDPKDGLTIYKRIQE